MNLLLDAGNSRLKWALSAAPEPGSTLHGFGNCDLADIGSALTELQQALPSRVKRIVAANVAGADFAQALRGAAREMSDGGVEFLVPANEAYGVRCAYAEPHRLGADRWAGVIAAHARAPAGALVVGLGTACTLDAVAGGEHLGGLILPGPFLMARSLAGNTRGIGDVRPLADPGAGRDALGRSTEEAVSFGAVWALAGAVERVLRETQAALASEPRVFLTGGAAPRLAPYLSASFEQRPHLVLEGLAVIAAAGRLAPGQAP